MGDFAGFPSSERLDIIAEAARAMAVDFTIVEKDFWVCWTLQGLFSLPLGHAPMVFKGGTSLSKAYGLIQRFSEDIDIVTAVSYYLSHGIADPEKATSRTQLIDSMDSLDDACAQYIASDLKNTLQEQFADRLERAKDGSSHSTRATDMGTRCFSNIRQAHPRLSMLTSADA